MNAQAVCKDVESGKWSSILPASYQTSLPPEELLHSGNCGLLIHRVGQVKYEFRKEGREFARDLQQYTNRALHPYVTTLLYEEIFGCEDRLHWFIHMTAPNDYGRILEMVDHDSDFKEVAESDRLPSKGGGNWEKMFAQGSFRETVIAPQHGLKHIAPQHYAARPIDESSLDAPFVTPAQYQTSVSAQHLLHSANAGAIIHRSGQVKYELRREGRSFAFEWQECVNRTLAGRVTVFLYEETWGTQDRIHWLIHMRSLDDFAKLREMGVRDAGYRGLLSRERIPAHKGGGTWGKIFVEGTLADTVLIPHCDAIAASGTRESSVKVATATS